MPKPFKEKNLDHPFLLQWQASEVLEEDNFSVKNKIIIFGVLISLILLAIFLKNFLLSLVLGLLAGVIVLLRKKKLPEIKIEISRKGIKYGEKFYSYKDLEEFWIIYEPPRIKTLTLKLKRPFLNELTIHLNQQNPSEVRSFLLNYLKENPEITEESIEEKILRWIGI